MKLLHRDIDKNNVGKVTLLPEEDEDMWHAYNIITAGDVVRATTIRKVTSETATGSTKSDKVRTILSIRVESIDFDLQACRLRVKGRNSTENRYVKMGAYHSLDLELNRKFTLEKTEWDSIARERVEIACDPTKSADVAAVVMQEGLANLCLVTPHMTLVRSKIEVSIPRKRKAQCSNHDKAMSKFFDQIIQAIIRHVDFGVVRCLIIGSPGFVKNQFSDYLFQVAQKMDYRKILENKNRFLLMHSSSGFKHSLNEILKDPNIQSRLSDAKAMAEVKAMEDFYTIMGTDPDRAFYGIKAVEYAVSLQAVETLLVSDSLFRSKDSVLTRKRYVALVDTVRENCGAVHIFSSLHVSGEQLSQISGIAAILRFPLQWEDTDDEEEEPYDEIIDVRDGLEEVSLTPTMLIC